MYQSKVGIQEYCISRQALIFNLKNQSMTVLYAKKSFAGGLILKVGKMNYCLGKMNPNWAKCLKSGQNFSRSGKNILIHGLAV